MRNLVALFVGCFLSLYLANGQQTVSLSQRALQAGYSVTAIGAHHRVLSRLTRSTNEVGVVTLQTNTFVQLATGLNRLTTNGWVESRPELVETQNGIVARGAQHGVLFSDNLNSPGSVQIKMSDGQWFKGHPLCLAYRDSSTGTNVFIAKLHDSFAQIVGTNRVVYPDAFEGVDASVSYTFTRAGLSQDIRFHARPPSPESFGLNPATTHLLAFTEVTESPAPQIQERNWDAGTEVMEDQTIGLGPMRMIPGRAFRASNARRYAGHTVAKKWETIDGRTFIVERLQWSHVKADLLQLPDVQTNSVSAATNASIIKNDRWYALKGLPPMPKGKSRAGRSSKQMASASEAGDFVLDWEMVNGDNGVWYFYCDTTWWVDGYCYLSEADFWADAVVKYSPGSSLEIGGPFYWNGDGGCGGGPAVLTEVNDDSYGQHIDYGGSPSAGDYGPALILDDCSYLQIATDNLDIHYASQGVVPASPCISTVTIAATKPVAIKGVTPEYVGTFTVTRIDGNWNQDLPVQLDFTGTAVVGSGGSGDYNLTGSATILANQGSATITVHPHAPPVPAGDTFEKTVIATIHSDPSYIIGAPSVATVCIEDPTATVLSSPVTAPSGMISWWRAENDATDGQGANNGTFSGTYQSAYVGRGFEFDGVSYRMTVNSSSSLNFANNADYSIEAWIRVTPAVTAYGVQSIVDKRNTPSDSAATGYTLHLVNGQLGCQISPGGAVYNFGPAGPDLRDGYFHHVAVSVDRDSTTGGHLYVDGSPILTFNATIAQGDLSNSELFRIGNHASPWLNAYFKGVIDEVGIYNRALSQAEIQSIYTAGRAGKCAGPIIVTQPQSQSVVGGANATLTVGVSSSACSPLTYEWFHNGSLVVGATSSALALTGVHLADAGQYTAIAANNVASKSSSAATLIVQEVATPVFSPVGGSYPSAQDVTITCATAGATIHYTIGGSDPTESSPTIASGSSVHIDQPVQTLKAKAWKTGWTPSDTETEGYQINAPGPTPTVTISPPTGTSILASDDLQVIVEASDAEETITLVQLFRDGVKVAESTQDTLTYTMSEVFAGSYTFTAKAIDNQGLVGTATPVTITVSASGPVVSLSGSQPYFSSSPATLLASVLGVNPGTLTALTLNGNPMPLRTGHFQLNPNLTSQGANPFTLAATDNQSRSATPATTTVYLDSVPPTLAITAPVNGASFNTARINVSGTFTETNLKRITVNGVPAFITGNTFTALNVPLGGDVVGIAAGEDHSLAVRSDGRVVGWGSGSYGQQNPPSDLNDARIVAAGWQDSLALRANGTVRCWGRDDDGQATPPGDLTGATAIAAGAFHSLALKADGTVIGWGDNTYDESYLASFQPIIAITAGSGFSLGVQQDGTIIAAGKNDLGQTTPPANLNGVVALAAGWDHCLALKSDGTVAGWGRNDVGQATPPGDLNNVIAIAAGGHHSLALKSDGTVVVWGSDFYGEGSSLPGLKATAIAAAAFHNVAITTSGTVVSWGFDAYGETEVPASANQQTITATAEDLAGNINTYSVTLNRTPDAAGNLVDPVQLSANSIAVLTGGNVTFTPQATVPGTLIVPGGVQYDFNGDGVIDQTADNLNPLSHTYSTAGQYFPVVTIQTTAGKFSSLGGWNAPDGSRLRINVQDPPQQQVSSTINVTSPVDLKATAGGMLYILSGNGKLFEYDTTQTPPQRIRLLSSIGKTPTGLDVDGDGNVYVVLSGDDQVAKFNPTGNPPNGSFALDLTFGTGGKIGGTGTDNGKFNAPYDVAVGPNGSGITVSDSVNNRIEMFDSNGNFIDKFGESGSGVAQFSAPKGLAYDKSGYLYVVDSGNNRVSLVLPPVTVGVSGSAGAGLGQFQGAINLTVGERGIYVADTGNNRIQSFDPLPRGLGGSKTPFTPRASISSGLSLSQPAAVVAATNLLQEMIYIADTGNNHVILVKLAAEDPTPAWNTLVTHAQSGDVSGAASCFSSATREGYRQAFLNLGATDMAAQINEINQIGLTPVFIRNDTAEYYFEESFDSHLLLFPVEFVKENGVWKILEF